MIDVPPGVFPSSEKVLKDDKVAEYGEQMNGFYRSLVELNCNIYIAERFLDFPYRLFDDGCTSDGLFFDLTVKNYFIASILLITKVATDQGSDVTTLPMFRKRLWLMVKPEHQQAIQDRLRAVHFDQRTKELLEKAKYLRDAQIAHFVRGPKQERLTLSEIKTLRDELNTLLQALSFETEYVMLPFSYESQKGDVDWVLDSIAKSSALLNMPERDLYRWQHTRRHLSDEDIPDAIYFS